MPTFTRLHVKTDQQRREGPTGKRDGGGGPRREREESSRARSRIKQFYPSTRPQRLVNE